jgi:Transglutaminase-like superfamily
MLNPAAADSSIERNLPLRSRRVRAVWLSRDLIWASLIVPFVELLRNGTSLHRATRIARALSHGVPRSPEGRLKLRRAIAAVDARFPDGGNCLRRSLLEIALDAGAAAETLYAGFQARGGRNSGHAWLASHPDQAERYDAVVTL